ncbi:hypothetical protein [Paraburkholderia graminis]
MLAAHHEALGLEELGAEFAQAVPFDGADKGAARHIKLLDPAKPYFQCTDAVNTARLKLKPEQKKDKSKTLSLGDVVDADNQTVADATTRVTQLLTAMQIDPSKKQALRMAAADLTKRTAKLTTDQAELTTALKVVQDVQTVVWPSRGDVFKSDHAFKMNEDSAQKWVNSYVDTPTLNTPVSGTDRPRGPLAMQ